MGVEKIEKSVTLNTKAQCACLNLKSVTQFIKQTLSLGYWLG